MSFLSRLFGPLFGKPPAGAGSDRYLPVYVFSQRCREPVAGQIDLMNEVSLDDENAGGYYVRKVIHTSGKGRCFGEVEVEAWLDSKKRLVRQEVHGGRWLSADDYEAEVAAAAAREQEALAAAKAQAETQAQSPDQTDSDQPQKE
jgi:hypothetical protein